MLKIIIAATVFSTIALVLGGLMLLTNNSIGWTFVGIGVLAQAAWIALQFSR